MCALKRKRKLWLQVLALMVAFYIVIMSLGAFAMYNSSRNTYLTAKNDMIERDLERVKGFLADSERIYWFFDYSKNHVKEIKDSSEENDPEQLSEAYASLPQSPTVEDLDALTDKEKLLIAWDTYNHLKFVLDTQLQNFGYGGISCFDIRPDSCGFVYYEAERRDIENGLLGDNWELDPEDHPAIEQLLKGEYNNVAFEIAPADWNESGNYYIGYLPLIYKNEIKGVLAIEYNWNGFRSQLLDQIRIMIGIMFGGMVISCALLMLLINRIAIKPLSTVQQTVREYMKNKDSAIAEVLLKRIKSQNEIGVLSDDIGALVKEMHTYTSNIKTLTKEVMEALAHTIDAKDKYTNGHSFRVALYSRMLARELGLSMNEQEDIYYMGLLHDIGKIGIPNSIINKPDRLTDEEFEAVKKHPIYGYEILSEIESMPGLSIGARYHHERIDGKGYPDGLKGEEIPFMARIIAVADSYDTMTSNRSYRKYLPQDVVRAEIEKNIGTQFDEAPARAMLKIIDNDKKYMMHE